jgi:phosphatidylinositol glycan class B
VTLLIDQSFYGTLTVPPVRFLYLNVMQDLAVFYGRNRVDYYFTEGLPLLLTTALPFAAIGLWSALRPGPDRPQFAGYVQRQTLHILALVVVTTVLAFSMIAHKEMRFIYPLLPILHVLAAKPLAHFFRPFPLPRSYFRLGLLVLGLAANIYVAAYVSTIHQRGVIDVMHYLRHEPENESGVRNTTVGFLMPCHSTPWRSHFVHPEINAWALTCEPPINVAREDRSSYLDEADVFYIDPRSWMHNNMADRKTVMQSAETGTFDGGDEGRRPWPEYLVFFEHLEPVMNDMLEGTRYEQCWRGFNTHWHDDGRRKGDVVVRCLRE